MTSDEGNHITAEVLTGDSLLRSLRYIYISSIVTTYDKTIIGDSFLRHVLYVVTAKDTGGNDVE